MRLNTFFQQTLYGRPSWPNGLPQLAGGGRLRTERSKALTIAVDYNLADGAGTYIKYASSF